MTRVRGNFQRYEASRAKRGLAFARKVAFRLVLGTGVPGTW